MDLSRRTQFFLLAAAASAVVGTDILVEAGETHGRITLGGFSSVEEHQPEPDGTTHNDFQTLSGRFFLSHSHEADEWTLDLRDKHDFFNKLDKERQELSDRNSFQARQASVALSQDNQGFYGTVGRFPILQAGTAYTDGVEVGRNLTPRSKLAVFGGLNPRQADKTYLEFNEKAQNYGIYFDYSPQYRSWHRKFYLANAFVEESYDGEVDRRYVYHNSIFQWGDGRFLSTLFYFDFVPKFYVQNSLVNYSQAWGPALRTMLTVSNIDVIQYRRVQDVRETLEPSPYREANAGMKYKMLAGFILGGKLRYGQREEDDLTRKVVQLSLDCPRWISKRTDLYFEASHKDEFTKTGDFLKIGSGYFSDKWEFDVNAEAGVEEHSDHSRRHPILSEASAGRQFSRKLYAVFSGQYIKDEEVEIRSVFFKLSYRFGSKEVSPLRDGAPPRGRQLF